LIEIAGERIELLGPELLVARHPHGGFFHGRGGELAAHHPPLLRPRDEPGVLEHAQVLEEAGKRHLVRVGKLGHRAVAFGERLKHAAPGAVGKRGEHGIELVFRILNHQV